MAHPHNLVTSSSSSFCYSDVSSSNPTTQTHLISQLSGFNPNPEIYNLTTGIEMIGFQSRPSPSNLIHHDPSADLWKAGFSAKPGIDPDPSKSPEFYGHGNHDDDDDGGQNHNQNQEVVAPFVDDQSSLRTCVFPCEGNERPSQGLSLSLSSSNPSTIGLQSFELRHHHHHHHLNHHPNPRDGLIMGKSPAFGTQEEFFLGKRAGVSASTSTGSVSVSMSMQFEMMRNSKYLAPAQELLNDFCNLGTKQTCEEKNKKKLKNKDPCDLLDDVDDRHDLRNNINANRSSSSQSLCGLNLLELQKRKTKLLGMLEELDRRYKHYYEQMKGVVSSFEAVAGPGAANVYSSLASKVMSRHFRCLRDSIVGQIKATKKAIGDKDAAASVPGTTKGETPRLRILDQAFRQQRALQQMTMVENHPWRPQRGLPERSVSVLRAWLFEHFLHPYPSDVDKHILARQTGLSRSQVSNWFINARVRLWKPMVEQMYQEETKDELDNNQESNFSHIRDHDHQPHEPGLTTTQQSIDQKPTSNQLLIRIDPESLSSIVNTPTTIAAASSKSPHHNNLQESPYGRNIEAFRSVESLDFPSSSSYNHHQATAYEAHNEDNGAQAQTQAQQGFGGGHVSLTLGLQQHGGNGVSLAFSSPASQSSLFYGRDHHIDDCQPVVHHQYSLIDGDQTAQNLPYRNLMGAQLLHDFA